MSEVVFVDRIPSDLPQSTGLFVISREHAAVAAVSLSPSFESDFVAAYGEAPTATASRGYAAGKLVDIAVEATDRDPTDVVALRAALDSALGVEDPATDPTLPAVEDPPAAEDAPSPVEDVPHVEHPPPLEDVPSPVRNSPSAQDPPSGGSAINWPALLGVAAVVAAAIGGALFVRWRRVEGRA